MKNVVLPVLMEMAARRSAEGSSQVVDDVNFWKQLVKEAEYEYNRQRKEI